MAQPPAPHHVGIGTEGGHICGRKRGPHRNGAARSSQLPAHLRRGGIGELSPADHLAILETNVRQPSGHPVDLAAVIQEHRHRSGAHVHDINSAAQHHAAHVGLAGDHQLNRPVGFINRSGPHKRGTFQVGVFCHGLNL
ncbi:MAG: hypothetical protein ACK559_15640 [bacterium]